MDLSSAKAPYNNIHVPETIFMIACGVSAEFSIYFTLIWERQQVYQLRIKFFLLAVLMCCFVLKGAHSIVFKLATI